MQKNFLISSSSRISVKRFKRAFKNPNNESRIIASCVGICCWKVTCVRRLYTLYSYYTDLSLYRSVKLEEALNHLFVGHFDVLPQHRIT